MGARRKNKQCSKVGYKTKAKAREALNTFGKARGSKRFYKCPHHDTEMWYLTSEDKN